MRVAMYTTICLVFFMQLTFVSAEKDTCPEGYYGEQCDLECSSTCRPVETYPCNKETGKCAEGCKSGYFGKTCERKCYCSETCIQETGACIGNPKPIPKDQHEKETSAERKTDVWMILAIIFIVVNVVLVLVVAFLGSKLRKRSSSRSTESSGEKIGLQTVRQALLPRSGPRRTEKQLEEEILDYENQVKILKDQVANFTDEHNRMVKVFGFFENSSYYLLKPPFDKSPWLQCTWLQLDSDKANIKAVNIDNYGKMSNKPYSSHQDDTNSSRFSNYQGTTSTNPVMKTGFTQYWEINSNIALNEPISKDTILLDLGFCSKKDEAHNEFTLFKEHYNGLRVAYCTKHSKICFMVLEDGKIEKHRETKIENKNGSTAYIIVGIMLDKDMKKLTFFDVKELHLIKTISIKCDNELWPMFGLDAQIETTSSNMSLYCGSDIHMTDEKLAMICRNYLHVYTK